MNAIPLSPVDYIFTGAGAQPITFAFSYSERLHPDRLRDSLNKTLAYFPVLCGKLKKITENDYEFRIMEDGLTFDVIDSNSSFEKSGGTEQYIMPVDSNEGEPLTKITLTQTPGGSVLAVSISHALVDGFSYFHFLSCWARICRGDRILKPYIHRDVFPSDHGSMAKTVTQNDVYADCGLFYGSKRCKAQSGQINNEHLFISSETIRSGLEDAKREHDIAFTENDLITALIWKKYIPMWINKNDNPETYMTCPFDFRRAMAGFPKNYFGCALCFTSASINLNSLLEASIGDIALLIRNSVNKIKSDYILNSLKTLENLRKQKGPAAMEEIHLRHPHHGMIVTNLTLLPIKDIDFSTGAPVNFSTYAEVTGSAAIFPAENGVEILIVPPPESI